MKIEWLVADVGAVKSLDRAEHAILGVNVAGRFFANPGRLCGRELLCGVGTSSLALITLLRAV